MKASSLEKRRFSDGASALARFGILGCVLGLTCLSFACLSVVLAEDGWQWRINKIGDGRLMLAFADFEASDDVPGRVYYCKPSSGTIEVHELTDKKQREVLSEFVRSNSYPKVQLEKEAAPTPIRIVHSEEGGWQIHFEIDADSVAFDAFKRTGQFAYRVGNLDVKDRNFSGSVEKISEFQAACRTPLANQGADGARR